MTNFQRTFSIKTLDLDHVIIYKDQAEVKRNFQISLKKGKNFILLTNVSASIVKESIQFDFKTIPHGPSVNSEIQIIEKPIEENFQISLLLDAIDQETTIEASISYTVFNASWNPVYDLKLKGKNGEFSMEISYFGIVNQITGEDWKNTKIILTGMESSITYNSPNKSKEKPIFLNALKTLSPDRVNLILADSRSYEITGLQTILSDFNDYKFSITKLELSASILHKDNSDVKVSVENNSIYAFLQGPARVDYLGKKEFSIDLKLCKPKSLIEFSLKTMTFIIEEFSPLKQHKPGFFSKNKATVYNQEVRIKNTLKSKQKYVFVYELPLIDNGKKFELIEPNLAKNTSVKLTEENKLEFDMDIDPMKVEKIPIKYSIAEHKK